MNKNVIAICVLQKVIRIIVYDNYIYDDAEHIIVTIFQDENNKNDIYNIENYVKYVVTSLSSTSNFWYVSNTINNNFIIIDLFLFLLICMLLYILY